MLKKENLRQRINIKPCGKDAEVRERMLGHCEKNSVAYVKMLRERIRDPSGAGSL